MTVINRSALVTYSAEQMFDLVNDIEQYPKFLPGCTYARIVSQTDTEMVGELCLGKAGIKQRFTTRNELDRPNTIRMSLVEGNFSSFSACWQFTPLSEDACKVTLEMQFEIAGGLIGFAAEKLVSASASGQVDAMVARAHDVYQ